MSRPTVNITVDGVAQQLTDGTCREVKWMGLSQVSVVAISKEPTTAEVYFHLLSEDGTGLLIPYGPYGVELFDRMTLLPGFDIEVTLRALLAGVNVKVVCWRRGEHVEAKKKIRGSPSGHC